jgi:Ca-activated chloride channel family protein
MTTGMVLLTSVVTIATLVGQTFTSRTDVVTVPVSATNRTGTERIRDLTVDRFRLFEDGLEQAITVFSHERRPVSLCIVLDSSLSMAGPRQVLAERAVSALVTDLEPDDQLSLVIFAQRTEVRIPWTAAAAFPPIDWKNWKTVPYSAVVDGLKRALTTMATARNPRTAVLLVTDGQDNGSSTTLHDIVTTRREGETLVYAFRTDDFSVPRDTRLPQAATQRPAAGSPFPAAAVRSTPDVLGEIVGASGGWIWPMRGTDDAVRAAGSLIDELRYQYLLGYSPRKAPDGKYRKLRVEATSDGVRVRHREGYVALPL